MTGVPKSALQMGDDFSRALTLQHQPRRIRIMQTSKLLLVHGCGSCSQFPVVGRVVSLPLKDRLLMRQPYHF
jgi:hypothetical protein